MSDCCWRLKVAKGTMFFSGMISSWMLGRVNNTKCSCLNHIWVKHITVLECLRREFYLILLKVTGPMGRSDRLLLNEAFIFVNTGERRPGLSGIEIRKANVSQNCSENIFQCPDLGILHTFSFPYTVTEIVYRNTGDDYIPASPKMTEIAVLCCGENLLCGSVTAKV